jgi:hypothetical protein
MEMLQTGHMWLDSEGLVVEAVGFGVSPAAHEISIDGERLRAWCAFDVMGLFGARRASGCVKSLELCRDEISNIKFIKGSPLTPLS